VLLASVLVAGAGFAAGRATDPSPSATGTPAAVGSGVLAVGPPVAQPPVGPSAMEAGVPVGFAHSHDGALMAAAGFTRVLAGSLLLHPDAYRAALQVVAAPAYTAELRGKGEEALTGIEARWHLISNAAQGRPAFVLAHVISAAVTRYDATSADVETFAVELIGDGHSPPAGVLAGGMFRLTWTGAPGGGDWRLAETNPLDGWGSTAITFPGVTEPRPPFIGELQELGDAPPSR
jgi:hypothetical protein